MSKKLLSVLFAAAFAVAFTGTSMADVWSQCAYGPSEGVDCPAGDHSVRTMNTDRATPYGMSEMGSAEAQGPVETGALPGHDRSTFESQQYSGNEVRNFDPSNTYPARLWNSDPWPTPNIQAGE